MTEPRAAIDSRSLKSWRILLFLPVFIVLGCAVFARFAGLGCGPFGGDERYVVLHALKFGTGDFNPKHFVWPASPFYYLTFACYGFLYVSGRILGVYAGSQAFALEFFSDPSAFYLISRLESALFGLGAVGLLIATARQLGREPLVGWLAGLLLLSTPIHIQISRGGLADSPMLFFTVATLLFSAKIATADQPRGAFYALAGASLGMATAMKYNGLIAALIVISAHLYRTASPFRIDTTFTALFDRRLWISATISVLTFFAATPFALIDYKTFLSDLSFQFANQSGQFEHVGVTGRGSPFVSLLGTIMPDAVGSLLWILAIAAIPILILQWKRNAVLAVLTLPTALAYLIVAERSKILMSHYVAPLAPLVGLLGSVMVVEVVGWFAKEPRWRAALATLVAAAIVFNPLWSQVAAARLARVPDTHDAAMAWVLANLPSGTKIVPEDTLFNFVPSIESIERNLATAHAEGHAGRAEYLAGLKPLVAIDRRNRHYDLYGLQSLESADGFLERLHTDRVEYYLLSETALRRFAISADQPLSAKRLEFYRQLKAESQLVAEFQGDGATLKGPTIWIYKLAPSSSS